MILECFIELYKSSAKVQFFKWAFLGVFVALVGIVPFYYMVVH